MFLMVTRKGAHSVGRKEFGFVEHAAEHALEALAVDEREETPYASRRMFRHFDVLGNIRMIVNKPLHAALEAWEAIDDLRLEGLYYRQRDQSNHGTVFQEMLFCDR